MIYTNATLVYGYTTKGISLFVYFFYLSICLSVCLSVVVAVVVVVVVVAEEEEL